MGRFAWTPSHRSQPSDGKHAIPEWFSKSSGEPSRQALTELVKEHHATSPPCATRTRTRTNTLSSSASRGHKSTSSRSSSSRQSRPASEQESNNKSVPVTDASDKTSQTLLSKGSKMMRRQTSKFNALSAQLNDVVTNSDHYVRPHGIQRVRSAGHLLNLHSKRDGNKPLISGPFDFQHLAHTDQAQYKDLCRSNDTDIADSFSALQADQKAQQDAQGNSVDDTSTTSAADRSVSVSRPHSPAFSIVPTIPSESPKPSPPPKDHLALPPVDVDVRISRSFDNFSRPNRTSPRLESDHVQQQFATAVQQATDVPAMPVSPVRLIATEAPYTSVPPSPQHAPSLAPSPMLDKPLPQPPTIVHAVSTSDLSTLFLKSTPLPEVPQQQASRASQASTKDPQTAISRPQSAGSEKRQSIRYMQSFPSDRLSYQRSTTNDMPGFTSPESRRTSTRGPTQPAQGDNKSSASTRVLETEDWEEAIDYSWDHMLDDDEDDVVEMYDSRMMTRSDILPQKSFGTGRVSASPSQLGALPAQGIRQHKSELSLRGLGIDPAARYSSMYGPEFGVASLKHESLRVPYMQRKSGSPMSKSSSQESIILSIASSIMSTHRSSNSSTSLSDINHLCSIEDESTVYTRRSLAKPSNAGSASSSDTVTTSNNSPQSVQDSPEEDTIVELPTMNHQRGASTPMFPAVPSRRSSMTPTGKAAVRQRSHTVTHRSTNSRASYSLFPTARPTLPPA